MRSQRAIGMSVALIALGSRAVWPDVVYFTQGYFLEAEVVDKGDKWLLLPIPDARIRISKPKLAPKSDVFKIVLDKDFRERFEAKQQALAPGDVKGKQKLVEWAHAEHFTVYARKAAEEALETLKQNAEKQGTADAFCEAGKWARSLPQRHYLPKEEGTRLLEAALKIDPEHEGAHKALKHRKHEDRWVTAKEYKELTRAPRVRKRRRRAKKSKEKPKLWHTALTGASPFGSKPEDIIKACGAPSSRSTHTSSSARSGESKYEYLTFSEDGIQTRVRFLNDSLSSITVDAGLNARPSEDQCYLDGKLIPKKERKKALKGIFSERRPALGMTEAEVERACGRPAYTSSHQTSDGHSTYGHWTYRPPGKRRVEVNFRNGVVRSIQISHSSFY